MNEMLVENRQYVRARSARARLLAGIPVREDVVEAAGIATAMLIGGKGQPMVLLHGPGEDAINWRWVMPELTQTHTVIAPDLPAHGRTSLADGSIDVAGMTAWLGAFIERTCTAPPVVVGHVLGGAVALRFAMDHGDRLKALVLVDSLGLARFRPELRFILTMVGFLARPTRRSYDRFMKQCAYDLDGLQNDVGDLWDAFADHNLAFARSPESKTAGQVFRQLGPPRIPDDQLARITVPTMLIWGRHDRANHVGIAEEASRRFGWPLRIIEEAADDPARDRPGAFVTALRELLNDELDGGDQPDLTL